MRILLTIDPLPLPCSISKRHEQRRREWLVKPRGGERGREPPLERAILTR